MARTIRESTPEEAERIDRLAALAEAEGPEIAARVNRMLVAEQEPGPRGELRRLLRESMIGPTRLSADTGVDAERLAAFREGLGDLSLSEMERLGRRVGFTIAIVAEQVTV
jgi:hypothetical protein